MRIRLALITIVILRFSPKIYYTPYLSISEIRGTIGYGHRSDFTPAFKKKIRLSACGVQKKNEAHILLS